MTNSPTDQEAAMLDDRLALLDRCRQAETRATTSQVASVIAHMIGTPLNVIVGRAALVNANPDPERVRDNVRRIEEQAQRLTLRIQRLLEYLDVPDNDSDLRAASDVVEDALALYAPIARHYGKALRLSRQSLPEAKVDGTQTLAILTSLLSLAIRDSGDAETVEIDAADAAEGQGVVFTIQAPGMEPIEESFDRFDPPTVIDPKHVDRTQMLALCAASAKHIGGKVDALPSEKPPGVTLRFHCPAS